MAVERIGVAIQGAGNVSAEHLRAYINNPTTEVVAIGSRTLAGASLKRDEMGLEADACSVYDSLPDLLANPRVDAVSICTPSELHALDTIEAAKAGKHILIEKPVAIHAGDLPKMHAAVQAADVRTVVSFVLRWNPLVETIKALIADGAFGDPFFVQTDYWHNVVQSRYPGGGGYRRHHPMSSFLAGGCHAVDMARHLMGSDVVEVTALSYDDDPDTAAPKTTVALVKFADGKIGKVSAGTNQWMPYVFNIDLFGPDGSIRGNKLYSRKLPGQTDFATIPTIPPDSGAVAHHPFQEEIDHFVDCIVSSSESHVNLADAINTHEVCFAAEQSSAAGGRPIRLPLSE
ncbi:MAG: oxidoreductase [Dehalococcoidia bacterium]|nr:oxidoreductase [Dehalococcoidia bacterium]